ncbi:MAG: hypothetical protein JWQ92_1108, partial [Amnibacterium sp.]|nr:hypothetical protein [Amnibacterium sp.]
MAAPYPMLRSAVEAGALAAWVLLPTDGAQRLARNFRARWDDIVQDDNLVMAFTAMRPNDTPAQMADKQRQRRKNAHHVRDRKRRLRDVATAAGVDTKEVE